MMSGKLVSRLVFKLVDCLFMGEFTCVTYWKNDVEYTGKIHNDCVSDWSQDSL